MKTTKNFVVDYTTLEGKTADDPLIRRWQCHSHLSQIGPLGVCFPFESAICERYGNKNYRISFAAMQGHRLYFEDTHTIHLRLSKHPSVGLFGIFDGHAGCVCFVSTVVAVFVSYR